MTKNTKHMEKQQKTETNTGPHNVPLPLISCIEIACLQPHNFEATLTAGFRLMLSFAEQWSAGSKPQSTNPGRHHAGSPERLAKLLRQQESLLELGWKDFG